MKLKDSQKTYFPMDGQMTRKWFLLDVKGKTLGDVATKIADILRGKGKPEFTPLRDCGDYIVAINASHIRLAGNKMEKKMYQWHTQYPSGFREKNAAQMMKEKPDQILYLAVRGMLPRNHLRKKFIAKLFIYPSDEHKHVAQNPQAIEL